jgi:hypothetical protein
VISKGGKIRDTWNFGRMVIRLGIAPGIGHSMPHTASGCGSIGFLENDTLFTIECILCQKTCWASDEEDRVSGEHRRVDERHSGPISADGANNRTAKIGPGGSIIIIVEMKDGKNRIVDLPSKHPTSTN